MSRCSIKIRICEGSLLNEPLVLPDIQTAVFEALAALEIDDRNDGKFPCGDPRDD